MPGIPKIEAYVMPDRSQVPFNVVEWKIDPQRVVLLIHDMQKYFVQKIPSENPRVALLKNAISIREWCLDFHVPIAYTTQSGDMTESERGLLRAFWGPGMKTEPNDREVVDELAPGAGDWVFTKWRYSAFYNSNFLQKIRDTGRDQLIICGVYAHIGVLATAIEAFSNDIEVFIVADAIADFSKAHHMMALNYAIECCARVVFSEEIIA